ncbi:MAG: aminotransferase class I/II-fold pyridoxal phosphate-dependent enzyme, partial [Verrucomicrobia bacterium]|nr:aminotransferase class I/II-fold pyridoxal phosphate-dependent enzyme [Verrucomicrobiota bacterium]
MAVLRTRIQNPQSLARPLVRRLRPYAYGEQPKIAGLIKLNTNENPYPPSPRVLRALKAAVDGRLRLYPNPTAQALREKLGRLHGAAAAAIIVGNGSDELLALAVRAFVEPATAGGRAGGGGNVVQYFTPSYSLYPVLADIHGATKNPVHLKPDFGLPAPGELKRDGRWRSDAALTLVTTPNAPSGRGYTTSELEGFCRAQRGVVVLDEAYANFADEDAMRLAMTFPHVIVARTFSKAFSLCFQRVGYFVGHPSLIAV